VTVLFADLVGYTTVAEGLDAEDARDLLDRYFAVAREIIQRYGGAVEKFIGDAVMAVWGAPTAHEDDAERAVRAAMDLAVAIPDLAGAGGTSGLRLRAGVLTGEAAVNLAADGQAMVAGDLVNTASRLQSVAEPGTVLVGESTYRATSGSIAFEPAGEQALKGRQAPVAAWRALSVVALVGGAGRSDVIEPPFVGRDGEFSALKERLHATSRDGRARLVSITGVAGIGKSRLAWELEKYLDGLVEPVYWHHGRSPAYGEGLAFWALGEMVRGRAGIAERDDDATTSQKLAASLAEWVPDDDERRWVAPRLRALLGLEEAPPGPREELFSAWRAFFERISDHGTTLLVFEDLHWADAGLLDFIESMLEWSRARPILIVTLARPELLERRPTWGAGQRDFTGLHLAPLHRAAMAEMVRGMAPGLPEPVAARIVERSEGVPLYAVEFFRMLVDRGQLASGPDGYTTVGSIADLDAPGTLQALIAARLDALPAPERRLLQDASVLGKTFTLDALAAVVGPDAGQPESILRSLVRRELLSVDVDPRSPERGQYGFVGALIREVAYGTLARRDRRDRHLAAARYFEALGDGELAGMLASHYADAFASSQQGPEADAVAAQARIALRAAAERSLSLGSAAQAIAYLDQAFRVTMDATEIARLHEEIARAARLAGLYARAEGDGRDAVERYRALNDRPGVARSSADLGQILLFGSRVQEAMEVLLPALAGLDEGRDAQVALQLKRMLARAEMFSARPERALTWCEDALTAAAKLDDVEAIADLMVTRSWALSGLGRLRESIAELRGALDLAHANGITGVELRAINNVAAVMGSLEPGPMTELLRGGMATAERIGDADNLDKLSMAAFLALLAGDWAWAEPALDARLRDDLPMLSWLSLASTRTVLHAWRERPADAVAMLAEIRRRAGATPTYQDSYGLHFTEVLVAMPIRDVAAMRLAATGLAAAGEAAGDPFEGLAYGGLGAAWAGDLAGVADAVAQLARLPARYTAILGWQALLEATLAARSGRQREAVAVYRAAMEDLRRVGGGFYVALAALEAATTLAAGEPLTAEAAAEVRRFAAVNDAPAFLTLLERSAAGPAAGVASHPASPAPRAQAGTPQNIRTTS